MVNQYLLNETISDYSELIALDAYPIHSEYNKVTLKNELFTSADFFKLRIQSLNFLSLTKNVCYIGE